MKVHKIIGYSCVTVLLMHPFFLVIPRLFESGIGPVDAFVTIITTYTSRGVVLGLIAWCLMLIFGITSLARKILPMKYKSWRVFHGILAIAFISVATWHTIVLGRHTDLAMSIFIILRAVGGQDYLLPSRHVMRAPGRCLSPRNASNHPGRLLLQKESSHSIQAPQSSSLISSKKRGALRVQRVSALMKKRSILSGQRV